MIRGGLSILCVAGGAVLGYAIGGFESAILVALIGFFLSKIIVSMLRIVDAT